MHHKDTTLYTHTLPCRLLVPRGHDEIVVYPTLVEINGKKIPLDIKGPVGSLTLFLDLKKGRIEVKGKGDAVFAYRIEQIDGYIELIATKGVSSKRLAKATQPKELEPYEAFHFGVHKSKVIERIFQRADLKEVLPIWLRLASLTPRVPLYSKTEGPFGWLEEIQKAKTSKSKDKIASYLEDLFTFLFPGQWVPQSTDVIHRGFFTKPLSYRRKEIQYALLQQSADLIRSLFLSESKQGISILPCLLPEFPSGKIENLITSQGKLEIRWSKKKLLQMKFVPHQSTEVQFLFPKGITSYRLRNYKNQKGARFGIDAQHQFKKGTIYLFDRFER